MSALTDDADQPLKPADEPDWTSSQVNNSNSGRADLTSNEPAAAADDRPSARHSKLTWSASGGLKQTPADDDDFE